jgi:Tfp pilus assembly protein PilF
MRARRHLSHAQGYLELGMLAEAEAELQCIVPPDDDTLAVIAVRMALLQEKQAWPELCRLAAICVGRAPSQAAAWVTWAYATRRSVSLEEAEKILLTAERLHRSEPTIQFNLGCYACQRGDLVTARSRVDRAIALESKFAGVAHTDPDLAPLRAQGLYGRSG